MNGLFCSSIALHISIVLGRAPALCHTPPKRYGALEYSQQCHEPQHFAPSSTENLAWSKKRIARKSELGSGLATMQTQAENAVLALAWTR